MENSKIEWTTHTFNPWIGCSHATYVAVTGEHAGKTRPHPGCLHCYAEADMDHRKGRCVWGPKGTRSRTGDGYWRKPFGWNKAARLARERRPDLERPRVFCASLADVFEKWTGRVVNAADEDLWRFPGGRYMTSVYSPACPAERRASLDYMRADLLDVIDETPELDWLMLTKRPQNVRSMLGRRRGNVWLGTSISDQDTAAALLRELALVSDLAAVTFASVEPLLAPICLTAALAGSRPPDWLILGGESGHRARRSEPGWYRSLIAQARELGVAVFMKQFGGALDVSNEDLRPWPHGDMLGTFDRELGRVMAEFDHDKGGDWDEWADEFRVRELPLCARTVPA